jgi:hypothetical protein
MRQPSPQENQEPPDTLQIGKSCQLDPGSVMPHVGYMHVTHQTHHVPTIG